MSIPLATSADAILDATAAGKALLVAANPAAQRAELQLGSAALQPASAFDAAGLATAAYAAAAADLAGHVGASDPHGDPCGRGQPGIWWLPRSADVRDGDGGAMSDPVWTCDNVPEDLRPLCRGEIGTLWHTNRWRRQVGMEPLPGIEIPPEVLPSETQLGWDVSHPSRGLGDTVAKLTHATGIDVVVKAVLGSGCGCQSRQTRWNRRWPYSRKEA